MNSRHCLVRLATVAAFACLPLAAGPLTVGDFSFEGSNLTQQTYTNAIGPIWTGTGGSTNANAFCEYSIGFAADATTHLGMEEGHDVWQNLPTTYQANTRYSLVVAVGNRDEFYTLSGNLSQYQLADSTGGVYATGSYNAFAIPVGTFADAPALIFDTTSNAAAVGKPIQIRLIAHGFGRSHFDQIRLTSTPLAAAGLATAENLPAVLVTATTATLRGKILATGNAAPTVTFFWGTTAGGTVATNWQNSRTLTGTQTDTFSAAISGLTATKTYYYACRTTNSAGDAWTGSSTFETLPLLPAVSNGPASQVAAYSAQLAANVTATGGETPAVRIYYGPTDGGTSVADWAASLSLGTLSGAGSGAATGLQAATPYYFRAFAQNSGGGEWAASSSSFTTLAGLTTQIVNAAATGVTGTTATLRGEVLQAGSSAPSITIFYGTTDGGNNAAAWASSALVGVATGDFTRFVGGLNLSTTYYYRCQAVNSSGTTWATSSATFTTTGTVNSTPVIHEIHYNPADDAVVGPVQTEFIELHNPGDTTVDLSNWKLASGVTFTFPTGTSLAAGGYLVIAQNPAALLTKYGTTARGPWVGTLSNSGDTIELRDSLGALKDTVSYQPGFPWPTSANGAGPSIELINSALDNDLGGSWRSSTATTAPLVTYIAPAATGWKFKKGTQEPSPTLNSWRAPNFNDSTWTTARTPIGYGSSVACNTTLSDMSGPAGYSSVYARKSFNIPVSQIKNQLTLKVRADDGCSVWINGREVYRDNIPPDPLSYNQNASINITTAQWTTVNLTNTAIYLLGGTNVLTVHGLNSSQTSSDFNIDAELSVPAVGVEVIPTPGILNSVARGFLDIPPQARQVTHTPSQPTAGVPVSITARITDPDGISEANLSYKPVDPGNYLRKTDPDANAGWVTVPMNDSGTEGDLVAGDSTYTAVIPASEQIHRRLIRYKLSYSDARGNALSIPYSDDEQPNFAYFVYNGAPAWTGAIRPGAAAVTYPAATVSSMQTYHLLANATDVENSQYNRTFQETRFYGTIVYDGTVYDHVQFKIRGAGSAYISGKNKWNIFFNRSRDLVARDNWGKKYAESWNNLLLNANASPWAPLNRGSAGIEEASSARIYELAGATSFRTNYAQLRVIDDAVEASPTDQYAGDLWGLYLVIEPAEGNLLKERGLSDGNIYGTLFGAGDKKHQGEGQAVDSSDWTSFEEDLRALNQTVAWYRANIDLDKLYTFMAINRLIGNVDAREHSNFYAYRRTSDNKWEIIGNDYDMMYIATHHWGSDMEGTTVAGQPGAFRAIMRHPTLAREFRNRCREIMSLLASDGTADGGQIGQLLNEYANLIHPPGQTTTWANLDAAMWNLHGKTSRPDGTDVDSEFNRNAHAGNFFRASMTDSRGDLQDMLIGTWRRTLPDPDGDGFSDFPSRIEWFVNFATNTYPTATTTRPWQRRPLTQFENDTNLDRQKGYGYKYLEWETLYGGYGPAHTAPTVINNDFPARPAVVATGNPAFPTTGLNFTSTAFSDPQGPATFAAWQWRIAEISAPGIPGYVATKTSKYEIESLLTSAVLTTPPTSFTIPLGVTSPGKTYRVRVRHKDTTGNWSHWSTPAQFVATAPVVALMHYWNFNTPATQLVPTLTLGGGTLTSTAAVVSDTANSFAAANARTGDVAGSHLRVNNPITATLNFALPTTGHRDILVQYETRRSAQGAGLQTVSYTVNGTDFTPLRTDAVVDGTPEVRVLDFREISAADNNPAFGLRITFQQGTGGTLGNNRFDNFTVEGEALGGNFNSWKLANFPNPADQANLAISGPNASPSGDGHSNLLHYALGVGPFQPITGLLPQVVKAGGTSQFRFRYDPTKPDLIWRVKASNTLTSWPSVLFDSSTSTSPPRVDGLSSVTLPATLGTGPATDPKMFVRLEVQLTP